MGWNCCGISGGTKVYFLSPNYPDGLWDPPSPLLNGHQGLFPELKRWNIKLTDLLHQVPRLRISGNKPSLQHTSLWSAEGLYFLIYPPIKFNPACHRNSDLARIINVHYVNFLADSPKSCSFIQRGCPCESKHWHSVMEAESLRRWFRQ